MKEFRYSLLRQRFVKGNIPAMWQISLLKNDGIKQIKTRNILQRGLNSRKSCSPRRRHAVSMAAPLTQGYEMKMTSQNTIRMQIRRLAKSNSSSRLFFNLVAVYR
ncbi:hypothetical protein CDAR_108301 [Caerostris darwini]|uniref:Uncharacterized protein n=1 Tax=Caerostris darwini TaxID=1538125 RepID=A0AAV4TKI3_9ARAC|nr:hypothetical protein CDAR_108301 [Caerostris darwini]